VETLLLTINRGKVTRIDVADNSVDLILDLWQRNWPYPHNIDPKPLVAGVDPTLCAAPTSSRSRPISGA
jgi:hypothetical protein